MLSEELERLQALREKGSITEEEFAAAKSKVLSQGPTTDEPSPGQGNNKIFGMIPTTWCALMHLSQLGGFIVPMIGSILPIVLWIISKDKNADADRHGRIIINWIASVFIYGIVCIPSLFIFSLIICCAIGMPPFPVFIGFLLLMALGTIGIIFAIIGTIKACDGKFWNYPLSIKFFKTAGGNCCG